MDPGESWNRLLRGNKAAEYPLKLVCKYQEFGVLDYNIQACLVLRHSQRNLSLLQNDERYKSYSLRDLRSDQET